jgi:ferredoxin
MELKQIIFIVMFLVAVGMFGYTAWRIWSYFKLTKKTARFDQIGKRTVHMLMVAFGQTKILRKATAGILHALVYWGFMVITVGTLEMVIDGFTGAHRSLGILGPVYDVVTASGDVFAAIILISCVMFLWRRYITKPKRFIAPEMKPKSRMDATVILSMIMMLMISLIGMNMAYVQHMRGVQEFYAANNMGELKIEGIYPVSQALLSVITIPHSAVHLVHEINWWIHIFLVLAFLNILPLSKHFHVMLSIPNVFFHRLEPAGQLDSMPSITNEIKVMLGLPDAPDPSTLPPPSRFGVKDVEDVTWKSLMDSYTCTECGRCTASCPANITGKKLSPRKIFIDLRARMSEKGPGLVKDAKFDDGKSLFDRITPEELWACTTCGACMAECPVDIEHVPLIVDLRRYLVMEESKAPAALNSMFTNIENNGAPWAMPASARFDWANEIYANS